MALEVVERFHFAIASGEIDRVVAAHAVAVGNQKRFGAGPALQQHGATGRLGDPVHATASEVAGHLQGIPRHQYAPFADADITHSRDHVVEQGLHRLEIGLGVVADPADHEHAR